MRLSLLHQRRSFSWVLVTKVILVLIPIGVFFSLLNHNLFLTAVLNYTYRPGHAGQTVGPVTASQLLKTGDPKLRWRISVDNFLFNVNIPRLIDKIRVRVRLDPGTQPYVALRALGPKGADTTTIISAAGLDSLNWRRVTKDHLTLWMRDKRVSVEKVSTGTGKTATTKNVTTERTVVQYDSVDAFQANPPDMDTIGLVGVDRMTYTRIENYQPNQTPVQLGYTLRGSHQFYVYAADETLKFSFDKIDLNRVTGTDGVGVRVARIGDLQASGRVWLKTVNVGDDGVSGREGPRGNSQPVSVEIPDASPGMYLVDIAAGVDVLLDNFVSAQRNLSFTGSLYIADGPAYAEPKFTPLSLRTNSRVVNLAANHEQGRQNVLINGKKITLPGVKVNHQASDLTGTTTIDIPKGDIIVSGDGLFSVGGFSLLPAGARSVDVTTPTLELDNVDYILAEYVPRASGTPEIDRTFDLNELDLKVKTVTFSIDAPGLQTSGATLGLKDIRVSLIRGPFPWNKVWEKLGLKK